MHAGPARNRVTPLGDIEAIPLRGRWTGNRGILHENRRIVRYHASDLWITCALEFRGRRHEQWQPHHYTFLYFHDEAVSLAAGHRPCAECRRASYDAYRAAWAAEIGSDLPSASEINRRLHAERIFRGTHRRRIHELRFQDLPDGAFVLLEAGLPAVIVGDQLDVLGPRRLRRSPATSRTRPREGHHAAVDARRAPCGLPRPDRRIGDIGVGSLLRSSAAQISEAQLARFGLYRPFDPSDDPSNSEVNHIQLIPAAGALSLDQATATFSLDLRCR